MDIKEARKRNDVQYNDVRLKFSLYTEHELLCGIVTDIVISVILRNSDVCSWRLGIR